MPRTELREGGAEGTGEGDLLWIDGRRSGLKESMGGETLDRRLDCFGVEGGNDAIVGTGRGDAIGEEVIYGWEESGLEGGFNGSGA